MITTPPHLNVPEPGENCLFYFHAAEFLFPPRGGQPLRAPMFALECLDSGLLSGKVKQKMRRQIPPSLYLPPTGAAPQNLSWAQSKHQRFRESNPGDCSAPCCCPWMEPQIRGKPARGHVDCRGKKEGQRFSINTTSRESGSDPEQRCMLLLYDGDDILHGKSPSQMR